LPGSGEDKHRAYAFQWFAMSGVTALLWVGLTLRRRRSSPSPDPAEIDSNSNPNSTPNSNPNSTPNIDSKNNSSAPF